MLQGLGLDKTTNLKAGLLIAGAFLTWMISGFSPVGMSLFILDLFIKTECGVALRLLWLAFGLAILVPVAPSSLLIGIACETVIAGSYAWLRTRRSGGS